MVFIKIASITWFLDIGEVWKYPYIQQKILLIITNTWCVKIMTTGRVIFFNQ